MASVQELLLAAQARKSPFISLLEGVATGYRDSQLKALDDQKKRQDIAQQKQQMQFTKMVQDAYEKTLKGELANASAPVDGSFPQQKLDQVINLGSRGANIKISTPQQYGTKRTPSLQKTQYLDKAGNRRIGSFDPVSGQTIQSESDAFAPTRAGEQSSKNAGGLTAGQDLSRKAKAIAMANAMFLAAHQDRYYTDDFGRRQGFDLTEDDKRSDEYKRYFKTAIEQLTVGPSGKESDQKENLDQARNLIPRRQTIQSESGTNAPVPASKQPSNMIGTRSSGKDQEVERVTKDGKKAIYNARTKQFIRWK